MARLICTEKDPWKPGMEKRIHPSSKPIPDSQQDGWPGGDTVTLRCPHCLSEFEIELPQ